MYTNYLFQMSTVNKLFSSQRKTIVVLFKKYSRYHHHRRYLVNKNNIKMYYTHKRCYGGITFIAIFSIK